MNTIINIFKFRFVKTISYNLAKWIQIKNNESHEKRYRYYYGLRILIMTFTELMLALFISLFLGAFFETLTVIISFRIIRKFAGGFHFINSKNAYIKCAYTTLGMLILGGILGKYMPYCLIVNNIIFIIVALILLIYAPVENFNRQITKKEHKIFKLLSLTSLIIIYYIYNYIPLYDTIRQSMTIGITFSGIIITPLIVKMSYYVDK